MILCYQFYKLLTFKSGTPCALCILTFAFPLCVAGLLGCSTRSRPHVDWTTQTAHQRSLDEYTEELSQRIPVLLEEHRVPGLSVTVVHEGRIAWSQGFGLAHIETAHPVTTDTVFQAGSLSKSLTALGVMRLIQERKIHLEDAVEKY